MSFKSTAFIIVASLIGPSTLPAAAQDRLALERRGNELLAKNCSRCHAIGLSGNSPHRQAPAFRTLGERYPIDTLAEALAEGLSTGHPDMPDFVFDIEDVGAILAYLESIQKHDAKPPIGR
jgi:mono/diheme cytochrome c family protein